MKLEFNKNTNQWEAIENGEVLCSGKSKYYVTWKLKQTGGKKVGPRGRRPKGAVKAPLKVAKKSTKAPKANSDWAEPPTPKKGTKKTTKKVATKKTGKPTASKRTRSTKEDKVEIIPIMQPVAPRPEIKEKVEVFEAKNMIVRIAKHVNWTTPEEWLGTVDFDMHTGISGESLRWSSGYMPKRSMVIAKAQKFADLMGVKLEIK